MMNLNPHRMEELDLRAQLDFTSHAIKQKIISNHKRNNLGDLTNGHKNKCEDNQNVIYSVTRKTKIRLVS